MFLTSKSICLAGSCGLLAVTALCQSPAGAAQFSLDWGEIAQNGQWPNGSQSGSFAIGDGTVDVFFEVGDGIEFVPFGPSGLTPAVNTVLNGEKPDDDPALHLQIDSERVGLGDPSYSVVMNTAFNGYESPIENVSFLIHDIDISPNAWQDRVSIQGFLGDRLVNPTFQFLSDTVDLVNAFTLDGIASAENDSAQGDVQVVFDNPIDRWSLTFTDGDDIDVFNPRSHGIGIGDVSWETTKDIPEPSASLAVLLLGAGLFSLNARLRRQA